MDKILTRKSTTVIGGVESSRRQKIIRLLRDAQQMINDERSTLSQQKSKKEVCNELGHDYVLGGYRETETSYFPIYECQTCGHQEEKAPEPNLAALSREIEKVLAKIK